jgi:histidine triad (HIT) family protein
MATVFTKIIDGEIPGTFVWRDDKCVAFMSINPLRPGHTLVVPRQEVDLWTDCPPELRNHLFGVSQTIAKAIQQVYSPERVGLMIVGLDVPHLHIHLVPIDGVRDLDFANAAGNVDREELDESARLIRQVMTSQVARGVSD